MGLFSWFFPSADDKVALARRALAEERWADARHDVLDLDHPDAASILAEAERGLTDRNLSEALRWAEAGDELRVANHLELAERFHKGGSDDRFRAVRRTLREQREAVSAEQKRLAEEKQARLMQVDPLGISGGPSLLRAGATGDIAAEDAEELAARLDLLIANYPADLRERVAEVGAPFARAVLDLDEGRADLALPELLALDPEHPLVCWEVSRAALALGDPAAAARVLKKFGAGAGHRAMGNQHSGAVLGQVLAQTGDVAGAIEVLEASLKDAPEAAGYPLAQLYATVGKLAEAEQVTRALITRNPKVQPYYAMLAQIRLMGGFRVEAMAALERGLSGTCCTPGKCGSQAPDPHLVRQLAILYLEDGLETPRALELADDSRGLVERPGFDDLYLAALAAKTRRDDQAGRLVDAVWANVGDDERRRAHVAKYLPAPA